MAGSSQNQVIDVSKLIYPVFIKEENGAPQPVPSMPGIYVYGRESLLGMLCYLERLGLRNILLFGVPAEKSWFGERVYLEANFLTEAIKAIKARFPSFRVFTDICLCAYTQHAHCGLIEPGQESIDSKATLSALSRMALLHAKAGADYVAPSAMAKNQVNAIRAVLNRQGYRNVKIMGYSAKFASGFYGPFREIAGSSPSFGDRSRYQLNYQGVSEALARIKDDIAEGADMVMVKPALAYLDIIRQARQEINRPLVVYNVSGEYAMAKLGAQKNLWREKDFVYEVMAAIKRAGADYVITYHAPDIASWQENHAGQKDKHTENVSV